MIRILGREAKEEKFEWGTSWEVDFGNGVDVRISRFVDPHRRFDLIVKASGPFYCSSCQTLEEAAGIAEKFLTDWLKGVANSMGYRVVLNLVKVKL